MQCTIAYPVVSCGFLGRNKLCLGLPTIAAEAIFYSETVGCLPIATGCMCIYPKMNMQPLFCDANP
jgi:hypothetical protein